MWHLPQYLHPFPAQVHRARYWVQLMMHYAKINTVYYTMLYFELDSIIANLVIFGIWFTKLQTYINHVKEFPLKSLEQCIRTNSERKAECLTTKSLF